jgi:hypothetical protein
MKYNDIRNREIRLDTPKNVAILHEMNDVLKNHKIDWEYLTIAQKYIYETRYDDVRNGLILPYNELLDFLKFYTEISYDKRVKYVSWMLNKYYSKNLLKDMNTNVYNENYEFAAVLRDAQTVVNMPSEKE